MCMKMERNHASLFQANDESKFDEMRTYPSFDPILDSKTKSLRTKSISKTPTEVIRDCASRSSIHSFPSLSKQNAHPLVVVLWLVSLTISWSYLGYQIYLSIALYNTFGVATSEWIEYEVPTNFPAVDICNLNPYNGGSNQVRELYDLVVNSYQLNLTRDDYNSIREFTDDANDHFKVFVEVLALENLEHFMEEFGFTLDQMLISCEFQGKPCAASDFYYYHDYNYGSCYRFNGGPRDTNQSLNENISTLHTHIQGEVRKSSKAGWRNGLRLELFAGNQKSQHRFTYQTGFRVIVHNQSIIPIPDEIGIDVAVGQQTNIAIKRTFIYHQPDPYSNCIYNLSESDAELNEILQEIRDQLKMDKIEQYSQKYCLNLCFQYFVIEKCECRSMAFSYLHLLRRNASECFKQVDFACLKEVDDLLRTNQINKCYDLCPIECNSVVYDFETHIASYPTEWYTHMANQYSDIFPSTGQSRLENLSTAMLNIYYDSMEYNVITETPILSFELLLANIGGNLGLFTGMSVLSLVEFVEAILALGVA